MPKVSCRLGSTTSWVTLDPWLHEMAAVEALSTSRGRSAETSPPLRQLPCCLSLAFLHERYWIIGMAPLQVAPIISARRSPQLA